MTTTPEWRKSSFSGGDNGNCVEIRRDLGGVRDTKRKTLALAVDVRPLTAAIQAGRFAR